MISLKNNYINKNINNVITYNDINISKIDISFNNDISSKTKISTTSTNNLNKPTAETTDICPYLSTHQIGSGFPLQVTGRGCTGTKETIRMDIKN